MLGVFSMGAKSSKYNGSNKNPYSSISAKDFERMCKSIDKAFSQLGKATDKGVAGAQAAQQAAQQAAYQNKLVKSRFRSSTGLTVSGAIMAFIGGMGVFALGNVAMVAVMAGLAFGSGASSDIAAVIMLSGIAVAFFALFVGGIRNIIAASHLRAMQRAFGSSEALLFTDLATRLHITPEQAMKRARKMLKKGYFLEGSIDDENTTLMVTHAAYQQYCQARHSRQQMLEQQKAEAQARSAQEAERLAREKELSKRLSPADLAFIAKGRDYQAQLRELDVRIDDVLVSERIVAIEGVLARILARAEEEPSVIAGIDRLTNYYLPTTVKLLDAYDNLEDQPIQGDNVSSSRREIEKTLEVLRGAFEKLLDDTYHEMSIDVSTDISVLHSVLAREGLTESPFDANPGPRLS